MKTFKGEKKSNMPESFAKRGVLPLKVLCSQFIVVTRSKLNDFQFIKEITTKPNTPDFGGYNTKQMQETN